MALKIGDWVELVDPGHFPRSYPRWKQLFPAPVAKIDGPVIYLHGILNSAGSRFGFYEKELKIVPTPNDVVFVE